MTPPTAGPTGVTAPYRASAQASAIATAARTVAPPEPGPAHLAHRRRHPTPWAQAPGGPPSDPDGPAGGRLGPAPVFVDDSGRRRRAGRWIGAGLGALVVGYVAVLVMAFAGVPLTGRLAPPGVEQLSRPANDMGVSVAPGAEERVLPPASGDPTTVAGGPAPATSSNGSDPAEATAGAAPASTTAADDTATTTATTAPHGNGATTTVPTPNSTVPDRTRPGPPTEPPGRS